MILRSLCPGNYAFLQYLEVMQDLSINSDTLNDTRIPDLLYDLEHISKLIDFVSSMAEVLGTGVQMRAPKSFCYMEGVQNHCLVWGYPKWWGLYYNEDPDRDHNLNSTTSFFCQA